VRTLAAGTLLALATLLPAEQAAAQDPVGGAIAGGVLGGIVGGILGHGRGAFAGAIVGATTGAIIASEAQQRPSGYYWWRSGCYYRYPNGDWMQIAPGYCGY
jgi:outer membrane lipoprotein SlyB